MAETAKAPAASTKPAETKSQTFVRLANSRVGKAMGALSVIGNLASPNYEYTDDQAAKIVAALQSEVDALKAKFAKPEAAVKSGFSL